MKKGLLLFALISFLFVGTTNTYAQNDLSNQLDVELSDNNSDKIKDKKKDKKVEEDNQLEFLGTPVYDAEDFWKLITKGIFNLFIILIIVRYIYYPVTKNKDYLFTYLLISLTVFLLCVLLDSVKLQLGFALGLFAIFGIIRYRTDPIPIKEMTYLFLVIGISVVNALANKKISHAELVFANLLLVFVTFGMERIWLLRHESRRNIIYEKIELIKPENKEELLEDLKERTGLNIVRYEIRRIDFLKDIANIRIFYYEDDSK
ncbi:MAG: DUF4956 domain-containing protein [Flavobacteriales bacterium]|jgi:hypothetical protein|nr:DUF4956 domain-containing protein [Flavobacteriales bacterium]MDG1718692.1 DUF4956 domain-containing protein [Flavobacteriales bacterium]